MDARCRTSLKLALAAAVFDIAPAVLAQTKPPPATLEAMIWKP